MNGFPTITANQIKSGLIGSAQQKQDIAPAVIESMFSALNTLGTSLMLDVLDARERRESKTDIKYRINQAGINQPVDISWLSLHSVQRRIIREIVVALQNTSQLILGLLTVKTEFGRNHELAIFDVYPDKLFGKITAKCGAIYLKNEGKEDTLLMSISQFLTCCKYNLMDLIRLNLSDLDLTSVILSWSKLSWVNLSRTILIGANLQGAHLHGATLHGTDLRKTILLAADLSAAQLNGANLHGVNLNQVNLSWADLRGADLRSANLSDAILRWVRIDNAQFDQHTNFDNIQKIELSFSTEDTLNNDFLINLFKTIEGINTQKYAHLKIDLMHQIIHWIQVENVDISKVKKYLMATWMSNAIYEKDETIQTFISHAMLPPKTLANGNMQSCSTHEQPVTALKRADKKWDRNAVFERAEYYAKKHQQYKNTIGYGWGSSVHYGKKSDEFYTIAANAKHPKAAFIMATKLSLNANKINLIEAKLALDYFKFAIEGNFSGAKDALSVFAENIYQRACSHNRINSYFDGASAIDFYEIAAQANHANAIYKLGTYWGKTSPNAPLPDLTNNKAIQFFKQAAALGHVQAREIIHLLQLQIDVTKQVRHAEYTIGKYLSESSLLNVHTAKMAISYLVIALQKKHPEAAFLIYKISQHCLQHFHTQLDIASTEALAKTYLKIAYKAGHKEALAVMAQQNNKRLMSEGMPADAQDGYEAL